MCISDWSSDVCSSDLILAEHAVLSAEQMLEEVFMPLAAGAEQVGAPDEEIAREVPGIVRILAGQAQLARFQLLQRVVGDVLAGRRGPLADLERVVLERRRGPPPAHSFGPPGEPQHPGPPPA